MFNKEKFKSGPGEFASISETLHAIDESKYAKDIQSSSIYSMDKYYTSFVKTERKNGHIKKRYIYYVNKDEYQLRSIHNSIASHLVPPCSDSVFSYKEKLSSRDLAERHTNNKFLFKLDIKDYFPSITSLMIEEMYLEWFKKDRKLKDKINPEHSAWLLSRICTRSDIRPEEEGGNREASILPIGISPASVISNSMLYDFDKKMQSMLGRGYTYSRYSDNIFVSTNYKTGIAEELRNSIIHELETLSIAGSTPFKVNEKKTQYIPAWRSQRVLGTVVNKKVNIPRAKTMKTRSALNHLYHESQKLHDDLVTGIIADKDIAWNQYNKLNARSLKVFGNLAYFQTINKEKYLKYSSCHHAIKINLENIRVYIYRHLTALGGIK